MNYKIGYDKWKHFYVGMLMAIVFQIILQFHLHIDFRLALCINMLFVNIVGFGFEFFSKITGLGHAEINDALATLLGGVAGAIFIFLFKATTN